MFSRLRMRLRDALLYWTIWLVRLLLNLVERMLAKPTKPAKKNDDVREHVRKHLDDHRGDMLVYFKSFDPAQFKGVSIPDDETEDECKLRMDIADEIKRYYEQSAVQMILQQGQQLDQVPPALGPKMEAFCQAVSFRLYVATVKRNRYVAKQNAQKAAARRRVAGSTTTSHKADKAIQTTVNDA